MLNTYRIIIIHGSYGSPEENWFPWLSQELELKGFSTTRPKLPTPDGQNLNTWTFSFNQQVGELDSRSILVGHSLAPAFILHVLQSLKSPIYGTLLVSPFIRKLGLPEFDKVNISFITGPFDWEKIRLNAGIVISFGGDNDPYVPQDAMKEVSDLLGVPLRIIKGGGHINTKSGYTSFPEIRDAILEIALPNNI